MTTRRVSAGGTISFATANYKAGRWLAGQTVEVVCEDGLVHLSHRGTLIATHARRHPVEREVAGLERGRRLPPAPSKVTAASVTRKVDTSGNVREGPHRYHPPPNGWRVAGAARPCRRR